MFFLYIVKAVHVVLRPNTTSEPGSVKQIFCRSIWTVCTTCTIALLSAFMKLEKKQYGREGILQNNEISSEIHNKTHT